MIADAYWAFVRRWRWLLSLGLILGIGAGFLLLAAQPFDTLDVRWPPQFYHPGTYQSTATLEVIADSPFAVSSGDSGQALQERAETLASLVVTAPVLEAVSEDMPQDSPVVPQKLFGMVDAIPITLVRTPALEAVSGDIPQDYNLTHEMLAVLVRAPTVTKSAAIKITVNSDDPAEAQIVAEKVAHHFAQQIAQDGEAKLVQETSDLSQRLELLEAELERVIREQQMIVGKGIDSGLSEADIMDSAQYIAAEERVSIYQREYREMYQDYVDLSLMEAPTAGQLFSTLYISPVEDLPSDTMAVWHALALGGIGGIVVTWLLAVWLDYTRRKRRLEIEDHWSRSHLLR